MRYQPGSLALGGGGLKGAAHIGILKIFEEEGFPIEYIAGSSAGSLIGALYASGKTIDELLSILCEYSKKPPIDLKIRPFVAMSILGRSVLNWLKIGYRPTRQGLVDEKQIDAYFKTLFGDRNFEKLRYPLMVTGVDLRTGRLQVFTSSSMANKLKGVHDIDCHTDVSLAMAVRASIAIPGIIPPVHHKGMVIVDGGVKNNVPADLLRFAGSKRVIAIDLGLSPQTEDELDDLLAILAQTLSVMSSEVTDLILERYSDLIIRPKIEGVKLKDHDKVFKVYERGYEVGRSKVKALQSLLNGTRVSHLKRN